MILMRDTFRQLREKGSLSLKIYTNANYATINIAHNLVQHDRTKHIEIDMHFIKEKLVGSLIVTTHIPIRLQVAYIFTRGFFVLDLKILLAN
ncbi:hypothetical protein CR513_35730, partial [Mucuna pruriens]